MDMKNILYNTPIFIISTIISISVLEIGIRVLMPEYNPHSNIKFTVTQSGIPLAEPGINVRHTRKTGDFDVSVKTNMYGLRDRNNLRNSSPDDIFVVGDSFSFGFGVEEDERYSNILDTMVEASVYNVSIPTNFDGYEKLLNYAIDIGAPVRNIIVGVCMENDLLMYGASMSGMSNVSLSSRLKKFLSSNLAVYRAIASLMHQNLTLNSLAEKLGLITPYDAAVVGRRFNKRVVDASIDRLADIVSPYNPIILIIPSRGLWAGDSIAENKKTHAYFVKRLNERMIRHVDTAIYMESNTNPLDFYYPKDGHWNAKAHKLAGELLAKKYK